MQHSRSASAQTRNLLALMLSEPARWLHGYEICAQCGLKSGTLYPILMRLADRGMLDSRWEPSEHSGRPPRKLYRLTAQGVSYGRENVSRSRDGTLPLLSPGRA